MIASSPEPARKIVVLTLTERCNLDCVYCFQKAKSQRTMTLDTAMRAIKNEFDNSCQFAELEIDLFGGEPTLCMPLVRELVEWTASQGFPKPYLFFLETNGTLVHGQHQEWLIHHRDFVKVGLSLDGTPRTHNRNRSGSYDRIDIPFFVRYYPEQGVRMTIHSATIDSLAEDIIFLHELGFAEVDASFAHGVMWDRATAERALEQELAKLCTYYLEHPQVRECSLLDVHLPAVLHKVVGAERWCGSGTSITSYGVDGTKYPCHTFQPNTTTPARAIALDEVDLQCIAEVNDAECSSCMLEALCPNCYGMNYATYGDLLRRDKRMCWVMKARALAVSCLRARQIEQEPGRMTPQETYQTIAAIRKVQDWLSGSGHAQG